MTTVECPTCHKNIELDPNDPWCTSCGADLKSLVSGGGPKPPIPPTKKGILYVITKDGKIEKLWEISETRKNFGREDLEKYAYRDPDTLSRSSKPHFFVWKEGDKYYIQDDASTNGTYIDGQRIISKGKIEFVDGKDIFLVNPGNPVLRLVFKFE